MSLFLDPDMQQALVRQAQAERTQVMASCFKHWFTWTRRAPVEQPKPAHTMLEKIGAALERYWALPLSRS